VTVRLETPSTQSHFEQWVEILKRVSGDVFDVDEIAHFVETDPSSAWLLALSEVEAVGCGVGRPSSIRNSMYAMVRVLPERRREGIGTQIFHALCEHAGTFGADTLWGRVREDDAGSRSFARKRGLGEVGREHEVVLDTASTEVAPEPPAGIELVSLADRPDLAHAVHAVDVETGGDVPRPEGDEYEPSSFERWRRDYLEGPGAVSEALIAAVADGEVVGYTGLRRRGAVSPVAENMLTAVLGPWRRRGIATALKREQAARARAAGIEQIYTTNDETNEGMRGANARLGFRPAPTQIIVSGPVAT
jgi:GNAT superfamily N-acetyltransferase